MMAERLGAPQVEMMMVYGKLRVVPLTRHLPLREVPGRVKRGRVEECLLMVERSLRELFGIEEPTIGLCALNPHAGEGGLLGREDGAEVAPAAESLRRKGLRVVGPTPADALFQSALVDPYDAYVAMYHDQGLVPFKMVARGRGVNVTLGLPVVRTSVDHGTAFDIAGRGVARDESLEAAYLMAERLARALGRRKRGRDGK